MSGRGPEPSPRPATPIATGIAPPQSIEAEQSVLGGVLLSDRALFGLIVEEGLKPEHFFRDRHRVMWAAMCEMFEAAGGDKAVSGVVDVLTLAEHLRSRAGERAATQLDDVGGKAAIDELTGGVPGLGGIRRYAQIVIEHALTRQLLAATYEIQASVLNHAASPRELVERAADAIVALTHERHGAAESQLGQGVLADHMMAWLEEEPDEGLPLPPQLPALARRVRLRPGHLTVLAAWSSGGKTVLASQVASTIGWAGHRVVIWTNEDTREELVAKHVQMATGVPSIVVSDRRVKDSRMAQVLAAIGRLPFEVQHCHEWSAEEIAAHIRHTRPTLAIVDHFHNLPGIGRVDEIDEAIGRFVGAAARAQCHVLLCAQLNRARRSGVCKPTPVLGDLRGSAKFEFAAHAVLLAHRDEEEMEDAAGRKTGKAIQLETGTIEVAKNKTGGGIGVVSVKWDAQHLRFVERGHDDEHAPTTATEPMPF